MLTQWLFALGSVVLVSVISLIGVITLAVKNLRSIVLFLVSFSAGAFFGDVFFHLLPEASSGPGGMTFEVSLLVLSGILFTFIIEKFVHWRHCHEPTTHSHPHPVAIMNLVGDSVHNFIDGLIIAASYLVSIPVGIATTTAVIFHEIPQELGNFGVLVHGGYSKGRALWFNFLTATTAIAGAVLALLLENYAQGIAHTLIPFAAGNFLYIAAADLIPELHKETNPWRSGMQLIAFLVGLGVIASLLLLE